MTNQNPFGFPKSLPLDISKLKAEGKTFVTPDYSIFETNSGKEKIELMLKDFADDLNSIPNVVRIDGQSFDEVKSKTGFTGHPLDYIKQSGWQIKEWAYSSFGGCWFIQLEMLPSPLPDWMIFVPKFKSWIV